DLLRRDCGADRVVLAEGFAPDRAFGSAHDDARLEALKAVAAQRLAAGQQTLDLGLDQTGASRGPLEIIASCSPARQPARWCTPCQASAWQPPRSECS